MEGDLHLETLDLARTIVDTAGDKQATDVILLDTRNVCSFTDYFVICSGESTRQVKAIVDAVTETLKKEGILPLHEEGVSETGWVLLDYGDVIVHIFSAAEREYYKLEQLWEKANCVVRMP